MTVDLHRTIDRVSDKPDASTAQRLAFLYAADERARDHARRIALAEARRTAGRELQASSIDVESRARGAHLLLSVTVEGRTA